MEEERRAEVEMREGVENKEKRVEKKGQTHTHI